MHFLYAIPNAGTVNEKKLEEVGLMNIFGDIIPNFSQRGTTQGPGGGGCALVSISDDTKKLYFKPKEQDWQQSLNGKYYIGLYNNDRPTKNILRRKKRLDGHEVELTDGSKWLVPVARIITGGSALPQSLILGKNGEIVTEALPQYAQFSAKAEQLWEDFLRVNKKNKEEAKMSLAGQMAFAIEALNWNYHISTDEANLLKLITTQNLGEIMAAIIDVPTLVEVAEQMMSEKKKEDAVTDDG